MLDLNKVYVIIGVDTETDVGSFTPFYEGVKHGVPKLPRFDVAYGNLNNNKARRFFYALCANIFFIKICVYFKALCAA